MRSYTALAVLATLLVTTTCFQYDCSKMEYDRCVRIADPLVKEAHLIFPDNLDDIDLVCRTWNKFVDCLKRYTDNCFTEQQRRQFNKAVENPIESVHQMCMIPHYQKEYLQYASCIKSTITERNHCGPQYSLLVDQVEQGEITSKATLCCSHDRFKQCVMKETRRICDRGITNGPASKFSSQIIDKAFSFLQDQCFNYIPNSGDCVSVSPDNVPPFTDPILISTSPSEVYPWSTVQEPAPKDMPPPPRPQEGAHFSPPSWLPSSSVPMYYNTQQQQQQDSLPTEVLGSRTRPASYGRSSWGADVPTTANSQPNVNVNAQFFPSGVSSSTPSPRPEWATMSNWHHVEEDAKKDESSLVNQANPQHNAVDGGSLHSTSTETWYPAAGNQLANEVDEPNQQGLRTPEDNGSSALAASFTPMFLVVVLATLCY